MGHLTLASVSYLLCALLGLSSGQDTHVTARLAKPGIIAEYGDCEYVKELPLEQQCDYLLLPDDPCDSSAGFMFNYAVLIYCGELQVPPSFYGVVALIIFWVINLFLMVGLTADGFFCPALAAIAVMLGLSENLAGVTLVSFGNGAPDLFSSVTGLLGDPNVELVYSQLMGGGLFVTLFVVGIICITAPFRVEGLLFMRDCLFYVGSVIWAFMVLRNPRVHLWEAVVFVLGYLLYIVVVLLSQSAQKDMESMHSRLEMHSESVFRRRQVAYDPKEHMYMQMVTKLQCGRKTTEEMETEVIIIQHGLFIEFLNSVLPTEGWDEMHFLERVMFVWQAPYMIILRLIIPVVDYDASRQGWSKVLNIINVFLLPVYVNVVTGTWNINVIGGVPMLLVTFLLSISLASFVALTSLQMEPPGYHSAVFAPLAFVGSVTTVYLTASEVVAVLSAMGLVMGVSPTTLGCTVLAWGNSIGDFVTIRGLAVKGYPRMAFAGVYGGTLFNLLLSLGVAALSATIDNGAQGNGYYFESDIGTLGANMMMYMLSGLVSCLIMLPVMGFQARKSYGKYLLVIYLLFNVKILLNEFELIHPLERVYQQELIYANGTTVKADVRNIYD